MTPRPILFVDHADALGGAEQSLLLLMSFLNRARWHPHLVAPPGLLVGEAVRAGIPVYTLDLPRLRGSFRSPSDWWKGAANIAAIARRIDAALIHGNTVRSSVYAALAARLARLPYVWHMRDFWLVEAEPARKWADRIGKLLLCRMAAAVITNSHAVAEHLPSSANALVLHNGIDLSHFDASNFAANGEGTVRQEAGFHPPQRPLSAWSAECAQPRASTLSSTWQAGSLNPFPTAASWLSEATRSAWATATSRI